MELILDTCSTKDMLVTPINSGQNSPVIRIIRPKSAEVSQKL